MAGIVRMVDHLGRPTLPIEFEETLGVGPGTDLEVLIGGDTIVLRKYAPGCVFCGEMTDVVTYKKRMICRRCLEEAGKRGATQQPSSVQSSAFQVAQS
ncbi:MAG: AbrB/MazE/SpoVT family DNA-binding domain-containing protein [Acidobacteriaceae bacterium]